MNRVVLSVKVLEIKVLRYTPGGLPAIDLLLQHESTVTEAGHPRQVRLELKAVVIGDLAHEVKSIELGTAREIAGFLAAQRNGRGVVLHITELH